MEEVIVLLKSAEEQLTEVEHILKKVEIESIQDELTAYTNAIERHHSAKDALHTKKIRLLWLLIPVIDVLKGDRYRVTYCGNYVEYLAGFKDSTGPFGSNISPKRIGPYELAETKMYWPVVEDYIKTIRAGILEASNPTTLLEDAEEIRQTVKEVVELAKNLKS